MCPFHKFCNNIPRTPSFKCQNIWNTDLNRIDPGFKNLATKQWKLCQRLQNFWFDFFFQAIRTSVNLLRVNKILFSVCSSFPKRSCHQTLSRLLTSHFCWGFPGLHTVFHMQQVKSFLVKIRKQANKGNFDGGFYYRPPDQGENVNEELFLQLQKASCSQILIPLDDLDHPDFCWK